MIAIVAAMDLNQVIGIDNKLPWHLPEDLKHFKRLTTGHTVVMGRKTFESLGRPLSDRKNIVLTRDPNFRPEGCTTYNSVQQLLNHLSKDEHTFIIGGSDIYKQFLPFAKRMYLTIINHEFAGDAFFPSFRHMNWKTINSQKGISDAQNPYDYCFLTLEKMD